MHKILQTYLRRLTNLTGNNRSLLLLRLISDQFIDVHSFDFLNNQPSFSIIEALIARKSKVKLCQVMDSRDDSTNEVSRRVKKLLRMDNFIFEERGSKDLYVGWPFLRGKFSDGTLVRAPLMFFPVALEQKNKDWILSLRQGVNITLNKSFLLAYAHYNHVKLDEELLERVFDDYDPDSTVFRTELYQTFKDSPVELNFNQENFTDKLKPFRNYRKADFDKEQKNGELKLYPEAVIGIFPQAGSHLVPDYMELIDNKLIKDIEEFFVSRTTLKDEERDDYRKNKYYFLQSVKEEQTFTPFKMDAFQENAIKAVKKGNSIVVQGPPGTGKSQMICNLISDFIARGKNVLLVSQKRAALDVVYNRLHEIEASDFAGLVHDFKNDRRDIYKKIARQIDRIDEFKLKNNSLDALQLERRFLQISRRIDQISEELEEFKSILFDEEECGLSVKELYLTSDPEKEMINLRQEYRNFRFDHLQDFLLKLRTYADYASIYERPNYPFKDRRSFAGYGLSELKRMKEVLEEIPGVIKKIRKDANEILDSNLNFDESDYLMQKKDTVFEMLSLLKTEEIYRYFTHILSFPDSVTDNLWLSNTERIIMDCFNGEGIESSLPASELGKFQEVLKRSMDARKRPLKFINWYFFSKDKYYLKRVLVANELKSNRQGFKSLVKKIDNRLNFEHNVTKLKEREWIIDLPEEIDKGTFQQWFDALRKAVKAKLIFNSIRNLRDYLAVQNLDYKEFQEKFYKLYDKLEEIPLKKQQWLNYLSETELNKIINGKLKIEDLLKTLNKDFDALCDFDNLKDELLPHESAVIDKLFTDDTPRNADEVEQCFQNSLRLNWIEHIETKYPILRSVNSMKFRKMEAELQQLVREKLKISNDILLLRAREKTYQDVEFNRLHNMVTYRELKHQVTKKRRIWPLRKLISHTFKELFDLIPCWMASPESVSAIFPMEEIFDLVIFDEASQAFAERGIPAMYRAKQVVIAGDNKQLRPNDLYKVRWEDDDEGDPSLEVDSLLELAEQYLMNVHLMGHYRSRTLDLIDFSNRHFYEGALTLLPDSKIVNKNIPAIDYIKVDGIWENKINDAEAVKVADIVFDLIENEPDKDIGIVTFNAPQQTYVTDVIEELSLERKIQIPHSLFIKNIENVQGDERDIIIFSTGYAPDNKGRMIMQFGSLNVDGGENRLNVAVTRAKEKIYIVSSIYPQQLAVEETKNPGPKLLKSYLEYAINVSEGKFKPTLKQDKKYHIEWYLKEKLEQMIRDFEISCEVCKELPFADLTLKQNSHYIGLVVTDDDLYHQSISIKESHVYKPLTMSSKNWKFKGIFSREFWQAPQRVKEELLRFINLNSSPQQKLQES